MKKYIISKEKFSKEDDVKIIIRETIPQPDKVKEKTLLVSSIKKAITDCDLVIANAQAEKAEWQKVLDDNSSSISESIL